MESSALFLAESIKTMNANDEITSFVANYTDNSKTEVSYVVFKSSVQTAYNKPTIFDPDKNSTKDIFASDSIVLGQLETILDRESINNSSLDEILLGV